MKSRSLVFVRYIFNYFHAQIVTIFCFLLMLLYYIFCILSSHYFDTKLCITSIIHDQLENGLFDKDNNMPSSLAQIGSINLCLKDKEYKKAILLIDNLKKNIKNKHSKLFRLFSIRQALIEMLIAKDYNDYMQKLETKYGNLSIETLDTLKNIYLTYIA